MNQEIQPRISKAMNAGMKKGGAIKGFVPESFEDIQRCATLAVNAGHFHVMKKNASGWDTKEIDEAKSIANATLAIMQGMECGMPVVMAIQLIAVINGRCVIWGEAIPALIWKNGHTIREWIEGEGDGRVAWCEITRGDNGEVIKRKFSVADAKQAGLWQTEPTTKRQSNSGEYEKENKSPWYRFQERMLQMRARGFCARDGVPDCLTGLYVREELQDEGAIVPTVREQAGCAQNEPVELPSFEMKPAQAPAAIEDKTSEEVVLPAFKTAAEVKKRVETVQTQTQKEENASPEDVAALIKAKFAAAATLDALHEIWDCDMAEMFGGGVPMRFRPELEQAFARRASDLETKAA